jgi:electron-transferring-flavoprotein dehydrogenase
MASARPAPPARVGRPGRNGRYAPSDHPPPVDPAGEFIKGSLDPEDDRIEVGVAIVGGGPAGLATANRLLQLLEGDPVLRERLGEVPVAVIEKAKVCGGHAVSGAVMRPGPLEELFPDLTRDDWPSYGEVTDEAVYFMASEKRAIRLPVVPPNFRNHGNQVVSVSELCRWMAERAEEAGAFVLTETAATQLLVTDGVVRGIRSGDKGRGRDGKPQRNFEPGSDVTAQATVLAEGGWGHLTGAAIRHFGLAEHAEPQVWSLGVKEVWEVPRPLRRVIHTLGWPLRIPRRYHEFGGSWVYPMGENRVSIGFVAGLDYADATFSVHDVLQQFKLHPLIRGILEGGERIAWGAKAIPEGGYWAMPDLTAPGLAITGDGAGMVNVPELKGIHYAIKSGILAAEAIFAALSARSDDLGAYGTAVDESIIGRDLRRTRNMRQPFYRGLVVGGAAVNAMLATGGRFPGGRWHNHRDAEQRMFVGDRQNGYPKADGKYTFDKLSSVFITGNATRDDAPNHIRIERDVPRAVAETWRWMCPAGVYELPDPPAGRAPGAGDPVEVIVNYTNCVQCGAITAKGGRLTVPDGGDGPLYRLT